MSVGSGSVWIQDSELSDRMDFQQLLFMDVWLHLVPVNSVEFIHDSVTLLSKEV